VRVTCTCGATWAAGTGIRHCTCHETFTTATVADLHRDGDRCLTPDEMRAQGLVQNTEGQWDRG
jgi:hypothetical protein